MSRVSVQSVDWWMSDYDETWHAFLCDQLTASGRVFLGALCEHSVPAAMTKRTPPTGIDRMCPPCVLVFGDRLPATSRVPTGWI